MSHPSESNENWAKCSKCGRPVLIDPKTEQPQPCAHCDPKARKIGLIGGLTFMLVAIAIIVALIVVAIVIGSFIA